MFENISPQIFPVAAICFRGISFNISTNEQKFFLFCEKKNVTGKLYYLVGNFHTVSFALFHFKCKLCSRRAKTYAPVKNKFNFNILTKCEIPQSFNCKLVTMGDRCTKLICFVICYNIVAGDLNDFIFNFYL